ncbi:lymphotoxin-alpha isoform X3 [Pangasianodon hypophthalmus]|uniref:lymphotoxin-alpha isoform X3 n=1 Tax=Pangasianodon hypophthalmus TaxID=310915 RepID=UPI00230799A5|nr:lymphotoxin-alpha isoform X3 [Pangasianodon hypophthalmus]
MSSAFLHQTLPLSAANHNSPSVRPSNSHVGFAQETVIPNGQVHSRHFISIIKQIHQEMIQFYKQIGENKTQDDAYSKEISPPPPNPKTDSDTKPAAFLHYNHYLKSDVAVMQWAIRGFPAFTHNFNYSNGCLIIPKDGFYYLFSKVSFKNSCKSFTHEIKLNSSRYSHHPLSLMTDRYSCVDQIRPHEKTNQISSYLGGVFKLYKKDKLFVSVSDLNNLIEGQQENFFGGFMI